MHLKSKANGIMLNTQFCNLSFLICLRNIPISADGVSLFFFQWLGRTLCFMDVPQSSQSPLRNI